MADGGQDFNLGHVVGSAGEKGDDGSSVWNTSTAPTYANSKYTFTISNLSGKTGLEIATNDIIFYSTYYYIVSAVNSTTVDCATRVSIKGSDASVTIATSFGSTPSDSKVPSEKLTKNSLDAKADASSLATVATTGDYDDLTDKPTIPSASTTTPSADTSSGSYGSGTSYARSNHTHPKSSLYAEATHSHTKSQITDFPSIPSKTSDLTNDGADGTNVFVANNDSRLSDARTPTSHTHGNITSDGKVGSNSNYFVYTTTSGAITSKQKIGNITTSGAIGSTSGKPIITTTSGVLTTGSFGTSSGTFAEGNHTHSGYISTSSTTGLVKNDGTIMTSGTGSTNYAAGNHTHNGYVSATKVTSWQSTPSDSNVPSEKLVKDSLDSIEDLIGDAIAYINL